MMSWREYSGLATLAKAGRDERILLAQKFFRMLAYGSTMLVLILYLQELEIEEQKIGLFMSLTLIGDVVISYMLTFYADSIGRRMVLVIGSVAMAASGVIFATCSNYWLLLLAAVIGVISPSGDEVGPFRAVEESTLAHLTKFHDRSDMFAWQGMVGTLGAALGSLGSGSIGDYLRDSHGVSVVQSYRYVFWCYSVIAVIKLVLSLLLSVKCEEYDHLKAANQEDEQAEEEGEEDTLIEPTESTSLLSGSGNHNNIVSDIPPSSASASTFLPQTKMILLKLSIIFCMDSLAYGFMPSSWQVLYFVQHLHTSESQIGGLMFTTNLIGSATSMLSSILCKKIGPISAIAATKIPSALFMGFVPATSNVFLAMALLVGRSWTDSMDVVPRQVFLTSIVPSQDRTKVMGIVNVLKTFARSIGPIFTGYFAHYNVLFISFLIDATLEIAFAIGLIVLFSGAKYH